MSIRDKVTLPDWLRWSGDNDDTNFRDAPGLYCFVHYYGAKDEVAIDGELSVKQLRELADTIEAIEKAEAEG